MAEPIWLTCLPSKLFRISFPAGDSSKEGYSIGGLSKKRFYTVVSTA